MLPYAELKAKTCFSLLRATDTPKDLVRHAVEAKLQAIAIADDTAVYGVIPFIQAAQKVGIQSIIGCDMILEGGYRLTLLVENEAGWRNLCYLISIARHNAKKGYAALPIRELETHTHGLIALSGYRQGEIGQAIRQKRYNDALSIAKLYLGWFGQGNFWIELQNHLLPYENAFIRNAVTLAEYLKIGYVATNNVHYVTPDKQPLQDIMTCICHNKTIEDSRRLRLPNDQYYLKSPKEMLRLFADIPDALTNTLTIAERCHFELKYGLQDLPAYQTETQQSADNHLRYLCENALGSMTRSDMPKAILLMQHELRVIKQSGLSNYFLIVADIVRFAREKGILCQGRGSAANSLVSFLLGISPVDPLKHNLVFERFLSEERVSVPDIDIDFQANRREEVIQYVYKKYGAAHTAMAATFVTYKRRLAIKDVGKSLGIPENILGDVALASDRDETIPVTSAQIERLANLCEQIRDLPRHLGIHNGGMIISGSPLYERLPTEPATMPNRVVVQWDKDMLETAGIVKIDILGLRMLSAIGEAVTLVEQETGERPELSQLAFDDPNLFQMMTKGDTIGVFQVESRAQAQTLPRLKPQLYNDLIVSISLIRPGPVQGNMVHPYLRRRAGVETVSYPHPLLESALEETLGIILFQEQVIKVARDLAGFTAGQGELLRRALGGKRPDKDVEKLRESFMDGAVQKDVPVEIAEQIFDSLKAFGGYSFPKSHAAAFAVLVYQSAWLKHYWPAQLGAALLNAQPMGFWTPAVIANDLRRHGIPIKRVDAHLSAAGRCSVEENALRIGFRSVKGMGDKTAAKIVAAQQNGSFRDLADFSRRVKLPRQITENLISVGAFDGWDTDRRKLIMELGKIGNYDGGLGLIFPQSEVKLSPLSDSELLMMETQIMGLTTGEHIMSFYLDWMQKRRMLGSQAINTQKDGNLVRVAGASVMHQAPPTAKGYHFITLEDKDGMINVIVRPSVYRKFKYVLRHAPLLWVKGKLQREGDVTNVLCEQAGNLPALKL